MGLIVIVALVLVALYIYAQVMVLKTILIIGGVVLLGAMVIAIINDVSDTHFGKMVAKLRDWLIKTPIRTALTIVVAMALVMVGITAHDSKLPSASDIEVELFSWGITESFIGIEYETDLCGYYLTNNSNSDAYVKLEIIQFDSNENIVDESRIACTLPAGGKRLLVFEPDEETKKLYKDIVEVSKPKEKSVEIGSSKDSAVFFSYEDREVTYKDERVTCLVAVNNTEETIVSCGAQMVYFDENGEVIAEGHASISDLAPGETAEDNVYLEYIPESWAYIEINEYAFAR